MATAHIVLIVDTTVWPRQVLGAGIFSESTPTMGGHRVPIPLASMHAQTYEEARILAERELADDSTYAWIGRLERDHVGRVMRDGRTRS